MIDRYTRPEMGKIWSEQNKIDQWLKVEVLACEAMNQLGQIPDEDWKNIKEKANFDLKRMQEIEEITQHDVIAFLTAVAEHVGPSSRYIHLGLTSSDVLDTGLAIQMVEAAELLIKGLQDLIDVTKKRAKEHKKTIMIGRSHGIHAEPMTFGLKLALMVDELERSMDRLKRAKEIIRVGQISGAVGTHANVDPKVEEHVCKKLGLEPAKISTQILQRDRHAEYLMQFALVAATLEKYAEEIRNLQKTEVREVEEFFSKGQKGSSAMPHKRNPITCERVCGLARVIRGNAIAGLENVALWHERDITHSSAERVIIPDSAILLDYILAKMTKVMDNLLVYPDRMMQNLELTRGLVFSQRVLLELAKEGMSREKAYEIVQRNAMKVWENGSNFKDILLKDEELLSNITKEQVDACFDLDYHLTDVDRTFEKLGLA